MRNAGLIGLLLLAVGLFTLMRPASDAVGASSWSVESIATPEMPIGEAFAINSSGQVAGIWVNTGDGNPCSSDFAFVRDPDGSLTDLCPLLSTEFGAIGSSYALGISDAGSVVGYVEGDEGELPFLWDGSDIVDLGVLPDADEGSLGVANDVNSAGQVVGWSTNADGDRVPFLWTAADGMTELPLLDGDVEGQARAINSPGQIVGISSASSGTDRAVLWEGGVATDLGALPGTTTYEAKDINDAGWIVGENDLNGVVWHPTDGIIEMGLPAGGYNTLETFAINQDGSVVGQAQDNNYSVETAAFIWEDGSFTLLPTLVTPSQWGGQATDINDDGVITGTVGDQSFSGNGGEPEPVLWTAIEGDSEPPVLDLPDDMTVEATSASGAVVSFTATATDAVDGDTTASCTPASGSWFPLGDTTVECSSTDAADNEATGSFVVSVVDTTGPVLTLPDRVSIKQNGRSSYEVVTYTATSLDAVDGVVGVTCAPGPGSAFWLGETTVNCVATDRSGNSSNGSFIVDVYRNRAPVASDTTVSTDEDTAVAFQLSATDPDGDVLEFGTWDGPYHGTITCSSTGRCTYRPDPDFNGTDTIRFYATDGPFSAGYGLITVNVTKVPDRPMITNITPVPGVAWSPDWTYEGSEDTLLVQFTDPDAQNPNNYDITVFWGDGSSTQVRTAQISRSQQINYQFRVAHVYHRFGSERVTVRIIDKVTGINTQRRHTVKVDDAPIWAWILLDRKTGKSTIDWPVGVRFSGRSDGSASCITDVNPFGLAGDLSATVQWGDGRSTSATIRNSKGHGAYVCGVDDTDFAVVASHVYRATGTYRVRILVTSAGGSSATATYRVRVHR